MPGFELFGDEERREVHDVLDTGVLFRYGFDGVRNGHWKARSLEEELCRRLGIEHCHVCSSGTSALSIALAACGIGAGDEVIVPPFTFVATVEAVLMAGAIPVFVDIDETLCLDPEKVRAAIRPETRAIVPVHMCGSMARIDQLVEIADANKITLIEDTAQAIGATLRGRAAGTFGRMGCFSFDAVKTITCGEGGAVVTSERELYERADQYADHGHDHLGADRGQDKHPILGANYRISELNAAVGLAQLRKLDKILRIQRAHKQRLVEVLGSFDEIRFREVPDPDGDSATFLSFFLPDETRAREASRELAAAGVDGCFYWYDNNWHYVRRWEHITKMATAARAPSWQTDQVGCWERLELKQSDGIMGRTLSMLIKLSWSEADLDERLTKIRTVFGG